VIRITIKLLLLFILVYAGVYLWYARLEKQLIAEAPSTKKPVVLKQVSSEKTAHKPAQTAGKGDTFQVIVARNIFEAVPEQAAKPEKEPGQEEKEPEETTLQLVLQGTVSGSERDARAIIVDKKEKKQDLYQVGDAVQGAIITAIERGRVILELNGRKQFLLIKEREGGKNDSGLSGFVSEPPESANRRSRPSFSRTGAKVPPSVVPHRRISFRQGKSGLPPELEEPEQPTMEEELPEEIPSEGALKPEDFIQ
jgi:type II secretion system protein C